MNTTKDNKQDRNHIISLIKAVQPFDDTEQSHIDDTIEWVREADEIYRIKKPAIPAKHLVCYTVVCDMAREKILLFDHRTSQLILPSGGHADQGEYPYMTAIRELKEELGIDPQFVFKDWKVPFFATQRVTVGKTPGHIDVSLWYMFYADSEESLDFASEEFDREFAGYKWYTFDEALEIPLDQTDEHLHRLIYKLKDHVT